MTRTMFPKGRTAILDYYDYPEIADNIVRYATPQTLRALRLASRGLKTAIDRRYQSMYRIWGHRAAHPLYRRRTYLMLASLSHPLVQIIEEFTSRPNPNRKALQWCGPVLPFAELNFATARPHIFFVFPRLAGYSDFDPQHLYSHSPLAELVRLIAASSLIDGTMWLFIGTEEWDTMLNVRGGAEGCFWEFFIDAIVRRRDGLDPNEEVTDDRRKSLNATVCATTRANWKEWSRPGLVHTIESVTASLLAERPLLTPPGSQPQFPFTPQTPSPYRM
ncbi:hypothetical protein A1Q1_03976 [Trichosporon asahii var. asahii CBS 2479]|uniref:Uncharacterized protein n=1 Tax=Trichosporon asahii var. asahii (strain ATCC 90039 / CBS 2479 / JCM 2466 / KCTC 7840 / NBRC 103889/ NCYC 2677 / UAMH 7654) TaxID=1186058 RepID=J4UKP2_TRIAS|nr:hypothetical protein A1Q1_03976 [Trichosporon asahii var. asahii CBS 2479]EJT52460.1 hypothetical protein A1Q1_03976 [Trichosporon asahii var. asahii CBS 2479]